MLKIFGNKNPEWVNLIIEEDIKNINKFLYLLKKDDSNIKIFIAGTSSYISNHSDLAEYFDNFDDYEIIGAGDMYNGSISHFKSYGFKITTPREVALEIYELLNKPELGGMANFLLNN